MGTKSAVDLERGFLLRGKETPKQNKKNNDNGPSTGLGSNTNTRVPKSKTSTSRMKSGFLLDDKAKSKMRATLPTTSMHQPLTSNLPSSTKDTPSKFGFSKGFLASKRSTRKTAKISDESSDTVVSSRELLVLEEPLPMEPSSRTKSTSASRSLLVLEENDNSLDDVEENEHTSEERKCTGPLISIINEEKSASDTLDRQPSPTLESSHGAGEEPANSTKLEQTTNDHEDFLFRERSTTFCSDRIQKDEIPSSKKDTNSSSNPYSGLSKVSSTGRSMSPQTMQGREEDEASFLNFQRQLASLKWQDGSPETWGEAAISNWTSGQIEWAWEWLLNQPDASTKNRQLIRYLLDLHSSSVPLWLMNNTPEERSRALQLIGWIQDFLITSLGEGQKQRGFRNGHEWYQNILPILAKIADQRRRTVLAQEAFDACILFIDCLNSVDTTDKQQESASLSSMMTSLGRALGAQATWRKEKSKKNAKDQAQLILLQDWRTLNDKCINHGLFSDWQRQVAGYRLNGGCQWGSLYHLFGKKKGVEKTFKSYDLGNIWTLLSKGDVDTVDQATLLRGIVVQIVNEKPPTNTSNIASNAMASLCKLKDAESCVLVRAILQLIWYDCGGLPRDIRSHDGPGMPKSLEELLESAPGTPSDNVPPCMNPTSSTIFQLVAEWILELPNGTKVMDFIMEQRGLRFDTIQILIHIASLFDSLTGVDNETREPLKQELYNHVEEILLNNISTSPMLRKCLHENDMFTKMSSSQLKLFVPQLLDLFYEHCGKLDSQSHGTEQLIVSILNANLKHQALKKNARIFVEAVTGALRRSSQPAMEKVSDLSHGLVLTKLCTGFKRFLLGDREVSDDVFADYVTATAIASNGNPSNILLLTFFGAIFGEKFEVDLRENKSARVRAKLAIMRLMKVCADKLGQLDDSVFKRLSPLLILRRIPRAYFHISRVEAENSKDSGFFGASSKLLEILSSIAVPSSSSRVAVNQEERRLAAEVAGRSFAYNENVKLQGAIVDCQPCSVSVRICKEAFDNLIETAKRGRLQSSCISFVQSARSALYTACHSIPDGSGGSDNFIDKEYESTVCFALFAIGIPHEGLEDEVSREVTQLQRGCIEFIALCIARAFDQSSGEMLSTSEEQVGLCSVGRSSERNYPGSSKWLVKTILRILCSEQVDINHEWITMDQVVRGAGIQPRNSSQSRICLWNSLMLVAQRSDENDGCLVAFTRCIVPSIIKYMASASVDQDAVPLTAALQVTFILLTRSKSTSCFGQQKNSSQKVVRMLHSRSLEIVQVSNPSGESDKRQLRMAALKLILALVTVDSMEESNNSTWSNLQGTYALIRELSYHDSDPDICSLATRICSMVQKSQYK